MLHDVASGMSDSVKPYACQVPLSMGFYRLTPKSQLDGHEFEQALEDGEGQGRLVCCNPWDRKESDMTWRLNNNQQDMSNLKYFLLDKNVII